MSVREVVTTPIATKLGIPKNVQQEINSFLMKPRHYYSYIYGVKPRFEAYELCLAAIDNAGSGMDNDVLDKWGARKGSDNPVFWLLVYELSDDFLRWKTYGIQLSRSYKVVSQHLLGTEELLQEFFFGGSPQPLKELFLDYYEGVMLRN